MKISKKTLWGLAVFSALGIVVYITRKKRNRNKLTLIAEEGYEIAHDILFPNKLVSEKKLHYGPVFPK
jgi:hypothetical protein